MSGHEEKPRGSFFDAMRDRSARRHHRCPGTIPRGLKVATAYSWRFLVVAAAIGVAIWLIIQLKLLVIPLLVAILVTALLWPVFTLDAAPSRSALARRSSISVLGTLAIVAGLLWLVIWQVARQWSSVQERTVEAIEQFRQYLIDGPLHLTAAQIDDLLAQATDLLQEQAQLLWSGALALGIDARPRRGRRAAGPVHPAVPARRRRRHLALDDAAVPGEGTARRRRRRRGRAG